MNAIDAGGLVDSPIPKSRGNWPGKLVIAAGDPGIKKHKQLDSMKEETRIYPHFF
jgi:hypothetical protein